MFMYVSSDMLSSWMPQPGLNRRIKRFFAKISADGDFKHTYARDSVFSKYCDPSPESAKQRKDAAYTKLWARECINAETNHRLRHTREHSKLMFLARQRISAVLGDYTVEELLDKSDFSNGASLSRSRPKADKYNKFDSSSAITSSCLRYYERVWNTDHDHAEKAKPLLVSGNALFTVPKNAEIDRTCAKEPDWNMYFQKGSGRMIRERLRRVGINLNDQSINQKLARQGSIDNSLATLDLSAASDSVTEELVYQLLPYDWYMHLDNQRSKYTVKDKKFYRWNLFSTMGNGFTFELESLIFYSLTWAVCYSLGIKGSVSVYGDDIICPAAASEQLILLLNYCGFTVNKDKSFVEGPFRESCGGHYYNGRDVTPIYIKRPISTIKDFILFRNKFLLWASGNIIDRHSYVDPRCREFLASLDYQLRDFQMITSNVFNGSIPSDVILADDRGKFRIVNEVTQRKKIRRCPLDYWLYNKRTFVPLKRNWNHKSELVSELYDYEALCTQVMDDDSTMRLLERTEEISNNSIGWFLVEPPKTVENNE